MDNNPIEPEVLKNSDSYVRYVNDPKYHRLVLAIEGLIHEGKFTLSEMIEACTLAGVVNDERLRIKGDN